MTTFIERKLGLVVNWAKSKVTRPTHPDFKFLGNSLFDGFGNVDMARPHQVSVASFKYKLKQLTRQNLSVSTAYRIGKINQIIKDWVIGGR